jgi:hypothetical protein
MTNPFTERGRITSPERFVGRWGELSILFDRLDQRRPIMVTGTPRIGLSSLLTHVVQSAASNMERPDLRAFYLDLRGASDAAQVYNTVITALGERGETTAALEVALAACEFPVLLCLDHAQAVSSAEWGERMLETLARMARSGALMLVVGHAGGPPALSERFAQIALGAFAPTEVRLLAEAYLEGNEIQFAPREIEQLRQLSVGHPAYLQRAAFHLYRAKQDPTLDWRAAYLREARDMPIPGAPLPPAVFEGAQAEGFDRMLADDLAEGVRTPDRPPPFAIPEPPLALLVLVPIGVGALLAAGGSPWAGLALAIAGLLAILLWRRRLLADEKRELAREAEPRHTP